MSDDTKIQVGTFAGGLEATKVAEAIMNGFAGRKRPAVVAVLLCDDPLPDGKLAVQFSLRCGDTFTKEAAAAAAHVSKIFGEVHELLINCPGVQPLTPTTKG